MITTHEPRRGRSVPHRNDRPRRSSPRFSDRGSVSIEFAITAAAVLAVIFTAIQAATWYWARSIAFAAAREAVDAERSYNAVPGSGRSAARAFVASAGDGLSNADVTVVRDGEQVQAVVVGQCLSVLPGFCSAVPVRATVHGTVERVTSP